MSSAKNGWCRPCERWHRTNTRQPGRPCPCPAVCLRPAARTAPGRPLLLGLTRSQPRIARAYFVQSPAKEWCIGLAAAKGVRKSVGSWCRSGRFSSRKAPRQQDNDNSRQSWRHSGPPRRAAATVFPLQARRSFVLSRVLRSRQQAYRAASGASLPIHAQQARILKRVQGAPGCESQVPLRAFAPGGVAQVQDFGLCQQWVLIRFRRIGALARSPTPGCLAPAPVPSAPARWSPGPSSRFVR